MLPTLDLDIRPGSGLGMFEIGTTNLYRRHCIPLSPSPTGSSLWTVLDLLRSNYHRFPQVDIKYDPDTSATTPVVIHVRPHLDLLFSGIHQRLHTICLRKLRDPNPPVTLRYKETVLSSMDEVLRRVGVSRTFGPTYPGDDLRYPGLWFSFEEDGMSEALKGPHTEDKLQEVKRVLISQKDNDGKNVDALDEVAECPVMYGDLAHATAKIHEGVTLQFYPKSTPPIHIRLGETTAQDLTLDLGPPLRVYYKDDERMTIHSHATATDEPESEYFYNYFQYGLDFLLSGKMHTVKKVILHTNIPGSPLFQRYKRCVWEIEGLPEDDEDDTPPRKRFYDRFETISHFLGPREPPASMVLDRTDDEDHVTLPSSLTQLHGYDGIVVEVTESSQVASLTLF
ncbi:hypothetical protein AX16_001065 [Volvariella volvacea WC 439]|nr:hypothetical protein AX16_001065 [Volvariella volvacea WC 439]